MKGHAGRRRTGDSRVDALLAWYAQGLFPMGDPHTGRLALYAADPRGVLDITRPGVPRVTRSLRKAMRNRGFVYSSDTRFEEVIALCARPRPDDPAGDTTWLTDELVEWYLAAHGAGYAHCVEVCRPDPRTGEHTLVGGVYGVALGAAFFGESMACTTRPRLPDGSRHPLDGADASKAALVVLCEHLRTLGFTLFDTQMVTEHVARMGGEEVAGVDYARRLTDAVRLPDRWAPLER